MLKTGLLFFLLSWTLTAATPLAYIKNPNTANETIDFIYWQQVVEGQPIPFKINNLGTPDVTLDPDDPRIDAFEALEMAFQTWENAGDSPIQFEIERSDLREAGYDGVNLIYFADEGNVGYGGVALITFDNTTGQILDADIHMNDYDIRWQTSPNDENGNPLPCPCPGSTSPGVYLNDIQGLATHEIGHILGLGHSAVGTRNAPATPTMYALGIWGSELPAGIPPNSAYRTIEADDIMGLQQIYMPDLAAQSATLEGVIHDDFDQPLFGVSVIATNTETGIAYGAISGVKRGSYAAGAYEMSGLPAGSYRIEAMPLDGSAPSYMSKGNFGGIASSVFGRFPSSFTFTRSYYPFAYNIADSQNLDLVSATASTVNFRPLAVIHQLPQFMRKPTDFHIRGSINTDLLDSFTSAELLIQSNDGKQQSYPIGPHFDLPFERPVDGTLIRYQIAVHSRSLTKTDHVYHTLPNRAQFGFSGEPIIFISKQGAFEISVLDTGTFYEIDQFKAGLSFPNAMAYATRSNGIYTANFGADSFSFLPIQEDRLPPLTPFDGDRDSDGITDILEPYFGTDPDNPDTDEDLTLDGTEIPEMTYDQAGSQPSFEVKGCLISRDGKPIGAGTVFIGLWNVDANAWASASLRTEASGRFKVRLEADVPFKIIVYVNGSVNAQSLPFTAAANQTLALSPIQLQLDQTNPAPAWGGTDPLDPMSGAAAFFRKDSWKQTLTSGTDSASIALDPCDEQMLYIASFGLGTLSKWDLQTKQKVLEVNLQGLLWWVCVTPDGRKLYVTNQTLKSIQVLDSDTFTVLKEIPLNAKPWSAELNLSGERLLVAADGNQDLILIDTETDSIVSSFHTGLGFQYFLSMSKQDPDLAIAGQFLVGAHQLVVVHPLSNQIRVLDLGTEIFTTSGLAIHPDGQRAYVVHYSDPELVEFDLNTGQILRRLPFGFVDTRFIELIDFENLPHRAQILTQPLSQDFCTGEQGNLSLRAIGCNLSYQWFRDGEPLPGVQNDHLDFAPFRELDFGAYRCEVSDSAGVITSQTAHLSPRTEIALLSQPQPWLGDLGQSAIFQLSETGASQLQWFHNGVPIPDATTAEWIIPSPDLADLGDYYCQLSNDCASTITSERVALNLRGILKIQLSTSKALGLGPIRLEPNFVGNPGYLNWTWYDPQGQTIEDSPQNLEVEPSETSIYRVDLQDLLTGENTSAQVRVFVPLSERYRDYDGNGSNQPADLYAAASEWTQEQLNDANGDQFISVLDLLYINLGSQAGKQKSSLNLAKDALRGANPFSAPEKMAEY